MASGVSSICGIAWFPMMTVTLVVLITGCSLQQPLSGANQSLATVGHAAPDWSGTDLDGRPIALNSYRGKAIFLNFWASWCGPCRAEQPGLDDIARIYKPKGIELIGVDIRDNLDQAKIYRDEFQMPYPSVFDQAARLAYAYQIDAPPSSVFINTQGVIVFKITGALGKDSYERIIRDKLLNPS
jgi:thiol-disulfide isomerase/thioredoxin